jgi:hypothetical protein
MVIETISSVLSLRYLGTPSLVKPASSANFPVLVVSKGTGSPKLGPRARTELQSEEQEAAQWENWESNSPRPTTAGQWLDLLRSRAAIRRFALVALPSGVPPGLNAHLDVPTPPLHSALVRRSTGPVRGRNLFRQCPHGPFSEPNSKKQPTSCNSGPTW